MVTAFIPVRGGSKSIPLKNIKNLCGRPLVYWSLQALSECRKVDNVIVATDSDDISAAVTSFGFRKVRLYARDPENARDTSSTESVMLEYIEKSGLADDDIFILVQATSPFTTGRNFEEALGLFYSNTFDSILSVVRTKRFYWKPDGTPLNYDYRNRPRRQDFEGLFMENGAFYINRVGNIRRDRNRLSGKIGLYEMPEHTGFEIDEPDDWTICEALMRRNAQPGNRRFGHIRLFITDVDGVLTDAGMYYSENGDELKKFNTHDGMGFKLLREAGIITAIMTSEDTAMVNRRAQKLKIDHLFQGVKNKLECAQRLCAEIGVTLHETAYIGDDVNDLELLSSCGVAACPSNAADKIKNISGIIHLSKRGGKGAVREFIELLLA